MKTPIFLLSFFTRYWKLLVLFVVLVILSKRDEVTYFVGPLFYLIMIAVGVSVATLLLKSIMFKHTLDKFTHNQADNPDGQSGFVIAFAALPPEAKLRLTLYTIWILFGGLCIVAASIAK